MRNVNLRSLTFIAIASFFLGGYSSLLMANAASLKAGDLISSSSSDGSPDIFLINNKNYKRYFLNPTVFGFYSDLSFEQVKQVSPEIKNSFPTSNLYRNCDQIGSPIYALEVTSDKQGTLHHIRMSAGDVIAQDKDFFKKVFCINTKEFNYYRQGSEVASLSEVVAFNPQLQGPATGASLKVISPNGGESWETGKTYGIKWVKPAKIESVDIVLMRNGKYIDLLAQRLSGRSFDWSIPGGTLIAGGGYKIRIAQSDAVGFAGADLSNDSFAIEDHQLENLKEYQAIGAIGRDATRIQDVETIQTALTKFFNEQNNSYPNSLQLLTPKYTNTIIADPLDKTPYVYKAFPDGCSGEIVNTPGDTTGGGTTGTGGTARGKGNKGPWIEIDPFSPIPPDDQVDALGFVPMRSQENDASQGFRYRIFDGQWLGSNGIPHSCAVDHTGKVKAYDNSVNFFARHQGGSFFGQPCTAGSFATEELPGWVGEKFSSGAGNWVGDVYAVPRDPAKGKWLGIDPFSPVSPDAQVDALGFTPVLSQEDNATKGSKYRVFDLKPSSTNPPFNCVPNRETGYYSVSYYTTSYHTTSYSNNADRHGVVCGSDASVSLSHETNTNYTLPVAWSPNESSVVNDSHRGVIADVYVVPKVKISLATPESFSAIILAIMKSIQSSIITIASAQNAPPDCTNYHLGVNLETASSPALDSDTDFNSSFVKGGFKGADKGSCAFNPVSNRFCYDVLGDPQNPPIKTSATTIGALNATGTSTDWAEFTSTANAPTYTIGISALSSVRPWIGFSDCPTCGASQKKQNFAFSGLTPGKSYTVKVYAGYVSSAAPYSATIIQGQGTVSNGALITYPIVGFLKGSNPWIITFIPQTSKITLELGNGGTSGANYLYFDEIDVTS